MKVSEIVMATGSTRAAIDTLLHRMVADREIVRVAPGYYACKTGKTVRNGRQNVDPEGKS